MTKGRVYCRDKRGREVPWGRGRPWVDFSIKGPDGKTRRFRRRVTVRTKAEAQMELARLMTEEAARLRVLTPAVTLSRLELGPCFDAWVASRQDHPKAFSARAAEAKVRRFVEWAGRDTPMEAVGPDLISSFRDHRILELKCAPVTARCDLSLISGFLAWCQSRPRNWISDNPVRDVRKPRVRSSPPEALADWDSVLAILDAVAGHPVLEPAYRLAFSTVCREEIALARWEDVNWKLGTLKIREGKNETRQAEIPLHQIALDWLTANQRAEGWIVPIPRNHDRSVSPWGSALEGARRRLNAQRKAQGLAALPGFHKGRHTVATLMARQGVPLPITQQMLRHSSPMTTARFYVGVRPIDARSFLRRIGNEEAPSGEEAAG